MQKALPLHRLGLGVAIFVTACALEPEPEPDDLTSISSALTQIVYPAHDAYVRSGTNAGSNYGAASAVLVDIEGSAELHGYMRFAVPAGSLTSAKLRLYVSVACATSPQLYKISNTSWTESTITWNNRPAIDGALLSTLPAVSASRWIEIDVTSSVVAGSVFSIVMKPRSGDSFGVKSKEGGASTRPELVLAYADTSCGDGTCSGSETCSSCAEDCGVCLPTCGDNACSGTETCSTCSADCGTCPPPPSGDLGACPDSGYKRLVSVSSLAQLTSALSNALPGDQIRIAAGTYTGWARLDRSGTATDPIVVCGAAGPNPVIKNGQFRTDGDYVVVSGLTFEGPIDGTTNQVLLSNNHHVTFTRNEIRFANANAGLSVDEAHHMTITYNYIHDNGVDAQHDHGIYYKTTTGDGSVIAHNLLVNNASRGISLHDNSLVGVFDVLVAHNTAVGNGSTGILVGDAGDRITLVNNISAFNGDARSQAQIRLNGGNNNKVWNNLTWSPTSSRAGIDNITSSTLSGNIIGNPMFVSTFSNLHLQATSPAINAGRTGYATTDYDLDPRDAAPDIGAYEY